MVEGHVPAGFPNLFNQIFIRIIFQSIKRGSVLEINKFSHHELTNQRHQSNSKSIPLLPSKKSIFTEISKPNSKKMTGTFLLMKTLTANVRISI